MSAFFAAKSLVWGTAALCAVSALSAQTTQGIKDIPFSPLRDPFPVPLLPAYVWWSIGIILFLVVAGGIYFYRSGRRSSEDPAAKINPLNIALEAIKSLENRTDQLEAREFSSEVSEIVRRYIEQACEIPAQEQTTEEFLHSIQKHPFFTKDIKEHLERFLGLCDMAKFAQQSVDKEQRQSLLKEAGLLVEKLYRFVVKRSRMDTSKPPPLSKRSERRPVAV
ncbi:MAG: DUF4381 family protein [Opitutales bacterium]